MISPSSHIQFDGSRHAPYFGKLVRQNGVPVCGSSDAESGWLLTVENDALVLRDLQQKRFKPVYVDLIRIRKRYRGLPVSRRGPMARALGRKTRTVIDGTAGWGQDTILAWMMGYEVTAIERSPVVAALLMDGVRRFAEYEQVDNGPRVVLDDAADALATYRADCVYLDPMFPARRKTSARTRRPLQVLRQLVGDDDDRDRLFEAAWQGARKRVVIKRPHDVKPWRKPEQTFAGKLMCYDLYLKG